MYVQIYILDTAEQLNVKRANNNNLDPVVMDNLQTMLLDNHPYIGYYRHVSQKVTYLFCDELKIVSKELMSRVRQATKDVVKSEV